MRQLCLPRSSFLTLALTITTALCASVSNAVVTISAIDESRASSVEGVGATTTTTPIVIYGGVAGTATASCTTTSTCNNCFSSSAGENGLVPCNERRISGNLILLISFRSTTVAGFPKIVSYNGTTQIEVPQTVTQGSVAIGSTATVSVRWDEICKRLAADSGGAALTGCEAITTSTFAQSKFYVGFAANSTDTTLATGSDSKEFTIVVKTIVPDASQSYSLATATDGIVQFKMTSGDKKGSIDELEKGTGSGFPNSGYSGFRWLRLLFEKRSNPLVGVWDQIHAGSPHSDLEILTDATGFSVSPVRVESGGGMIRSGTSAQSMSIENESVYDFKVAVVDRARNVGFYTPAATSGVVCKDAVGSLNPTNNTQECHTIRPSEVVGILAEKVNCYVSTAAYGSPMANEVTYFRAFRDRFLVPTKLGKAFVKFYYKEGPVLAKFIAQSDTLRALGRATLWLPLQFAKLALNYGLFAAFSIFIFGFAFGFAIPIALLTRFRRKQLNA